MSRRTFAVLISPSANRVYTGAAARMAADELWVFDRHLLDGSVHDIRTTTMGGVPYLLFDAEGLSGRDLRCVSNLSVLYALFTVDDGALRPVDVDRLDRYDDDLLTILKYVGKTNEQFTKLLLNVTAAALGSPERYLDQRLRVLDPLCGRGTTLNQAIMYGYDAYGIDVDKRDVEAYWAFILRWLKSKRLKHVARQSRIKKAGESLGRRLTVELAAAKEQYKAGDVQTLDVVHADTLRSGDLHPRKSFDLIVTDAPYGVQHSAVRDSSSLSRDPTALLEAAIPVWAGLLRPGGAIGLSWNTLVISRDVLEKAFSGAGLEVVDRPALHGFRHRVDQAIERDLIVARARTRSAGRADHAQPA